MTRFMLNRYQKWFRKFKKNLQIEIKEESRRTESKIIFRKVTFAKIRN